MKKGLLYLAVFFLYALWGLVKKKMARMMLMRTGRLGMLNIFPK